MIALLPVIPEPAARRGPESISAHFPLYTELLSTSQATDPRFGLCPPEDKTSEVSRERALQ